ncbi:hypothetical protein GWK47_025078 [Chionoecetes opilio]|uniref:Uncharacterized protein n=1 Tax=Chionoecetes opilio TaxID=41210 RepID=A0A8J4XL30_CHIOP|nr:hypothetical protein GWK47_025078 [Chionoecetes opilio]
MGDMEQLANLIVQQTAFSAQREERMVAMMERLLSPGGAGAASSDHRPATNDAPARLPAAATPFLTSSASLRDFDAWKMKFDGYMLLTRADNLPPKEQRAILLSLLDEDWTRVIRYALPVAEDTCKGGRNGNGGASQDAKERLGGLARVLLPGTGGRGDLRRLPLLLERNSLLL